MEVVIAYRYGADKLKNLELTYILLTSNGSSALHSKSMQCWPKLLFLLEGKVTYFHVYNVGKYLIDTKVVQRNMLYAQNLTKCNKSS